MTQTAWVQLQETSSAQVDNNTCWVTKCWTFDAVSSFNSTTFDLSATKLALESAKPLCQADVAVRTAWLKIR
jgi:hypothetical protein